MDGVVRTAPGLPDMSVTYDPHDEEGDRWRLMAPYRYVFPPFDDAGTSVVLTFPEGSTSNLASTPRIIWPIIAPFDLGILSVWGHDQLYRHGGLLPPEWFSTTERPDYHGRFLTWNRLGADGWFWRIMEIERIANWRQEVSYTTVRALGWIRAWQEPVG